MKLSTAGDPVMTQEDTKVEVGLDLKAGTLVLIQDGKGLTPHHAVVQFAAPDGRPWMAQQVTFTGAGPDGTSGSLVVDLLNDACDGPRDGIPDAIWRVVTLAATSAGDVGITYAPPAP
ncbi:hypothetical protein [Streptomyces thermoviolaceus]|uniref:hypothetical protein n=1 Tax=Streptomyces thermoviolaceus TaxID=1952 RepID=UPI001679C028|nr:hypothetical protein [Streptomyces thermoviolaceus]GGV76757.1 hypothetical protein GCM10010499_35050 [Streptomyces thermoviolaceus subsp. apingens]